MKKRGKAKPEKPAPRSSGQGPSPQSAPTSTSEWLEQLRPSRRADESKENNSNRHDSKEADPEPAAGSESSSDTLPASAVDDPLADTTALNRTQPRHNLDPALSLYYYRQKHLTTNGITYEWGLCPLPGEVEQVWDMVRSTTTYSTIQPRDKELKANMEVLNKLQVQGSWNHQFRDVAKGVGLLPHTAMLHKLGLKNIGLAENMPFDESIIPKYTRQEDQMIPNPSGTIVYGLEDRPGLFSHQETEMANALKFKRGLFSPHANISFPFFVAVVKDQDSMFACTNESLAAASGCVDIINYLNLRQSYGSEQFIDEPVTNAVFSLVMDELTATLQVTWSDHESMYYFHTKILQRFSLWEEKSYLDLWRCVHNIMRWGAGERFDEINTALRVAVLQEMKKGSMRYM